MKQLFFGFCMACGFVSTAQTTISGILKDSLNGEPVEFANIGIVGKGLGTVSNERGEFRLTIPDSLQKERIKISMVGYHSRSLPLVYFKNEKTQVQLKQDHKMLGEVVVKAKKYKIKELGNVTTTSVVTAGFKKNNLGAEIAILLKIKNPGTELRKFKLNIATSSISVTPIFRLNIYSVDENGEPGENILKQNVIITPSQATGLLDVDLKPYGIVVNENVFISVEWIKDLGDATGLSFSTKLIGSPTWFRQASQDKWEKIPSIGVGLHAEVAY